MTHDMSKHMVTVERKNCFLTGRKFQMNQAQVGTAW